MRLPNSAQGMHPWMITQIAPDFRLLDVWALPAQGGRDDFAAFVKVLDRLDPAQAESAASRALFWVRYQLGTWLRWDDAQPRPIPGCSETTLAERLPLTLRGSADGHFANEGLQKAGGFVPLYFTGNECAAEISNAIVHGVLHLAWVECAQSRYGAQMAVYVKPRGRLGDAYMLLIEPFRHLIVYPALMRQVARAWEAREA